MLVARLFDGKTAKMDYDSVPTTVFTPLEYGCCGLSEEDAKKKYGAENIKTYHTNFKPLEWALNKTRPEGDSYVKYMVNTTDDERVVGFHILAPNAGDITQGIGIAMKCGVTRSLLNSTVGIHPIVGEEVLGLT